MHGALFFPCSNISLTLLAPIPTNISTKSEPEMLKNGTFASPAIAFASNVFPVPGAPISKHPFGDQYSYHPYMNWVQYPKTS